MFGAKAHRVTSSHSYRIHFSVWLNRASVFLENKTRRCRSGFPESDPEFGQELRKPVKYFLSLLGGRALRGR